MRGAVDRIEVHRRVHRRQRRAVLGVPRDRLVAQLLDEIGPPVPLQARRIQRIEQAVHAPAAASRPGDRAAACRPSASAWWPPPPGSPGPVHDPHHAAHLLQVQVLRKHRRRRNRQKREEAVHVLGRVEDEVAVRLHHLGALLERPERRPRVHVLHRVQPGIRTTSPRRSCRRRRAAPRTDPSVTRSLAVTKLPSASTTSADRRLSIVRPYSRVR